MRDQFLVEQIKSFAHMVVAMHTTIKIKTAATNYIRNVNNLVAKNRQILLAFNPSGKAKKHRDQLLKKGFDFEYFTHIYTTKNGDQYRFCYEPGFKDIGNDFYLIVMRDAS